MGRAEEMKERREREKKKKTEKERGLHSHFLKLQLNLFLETLNEQYNLHLNSFFF